MVIKKERLTTDWWNNLSTWRVEEAWRLYLHTVNSARRSYYPKPVDALVKPVGPDFSIETVSWPNLTAKREKKRNRRIS